MLFFTFNKKSDILFIHALRESISKVRSNKNLTNNHNNNNNNKFCSLVFRATKIPEPLNKILEPTVIRHLDADSDSPREYSNVQNRHQVEVDIEQVCEVKNKYVRGKTTMTRHASLEGDDPGFIGPVVWNRHCQKIMTKENGE